MLTVLEVTSYKDYVELADAFAAAKFGISVGMTENLKTRNIELVLHSQLKIKESFILSLKPALNIQVEHVRRRPHLSRYFRIRNFFSPNTATVHTYPAKSTANPAKK